MLPLFLISLSLFQTSCKTNDKENVDGKGPVFENNGGKLENETTNGYSLDKDSIISFEMYQNDNELMCRNWNFINKEEIFDFLISFEEFSPYEWNQCFANFSCGFKGKMIYKKILYQYDLNAGGWLHLKSEKDEKFLGSKRDVDTLKFISIYYCNKDWD